MTTGESVDCRYCGDEKRPCICDDMELRARSATAERQAQAARERELDAVRREAAIAQRAACEKIAADLASDYEARARLPHAKGTPLWGQRMTQAAVASEVADAIARSPAASALTDEALAEIASARGMQLVRIGTVAELQRERDEARAELAALGAAIDEEAALDRERSEHGCGDSSCVVERPRGQSTNGGCRCGRRALLAALQRARAELATAGRR